MSGDSTLHGRFLRGLATAPRRPAWRVGGREVSYEQAHEDALTCAGTLIDAVGEPPAAIGVLANKTSEAYLGTLAALYAGAAVVPLHPDFPAARTRHAIAAAGVSCVLTDVRGAAAGASTGVLDGLPVLVPGAAAPAGCLVPRPELALLGPRPAGPDDPAYVLFTSGSTGNPKGVTIRHRNTAHYFGLYDARCDFGPDDVFSQTFDLTFDCAMFDLFNAWGAGACVVPIDLPEFRALPAFAAEQRLSVWFSVPSCIGVLRRTGGLAAAALPGLRWSFFVGEPLYCTDAAEWQAAAPHSAVENVYGPTELTISISTHRFTPDSTIRAVNGVVPIGPLHDGHDYVLLAADGAHDAAEGELCVAGPQAFTGYLDPRDDDGRFLRHADRAWYRTGDVVRRHPDGELAYLGRADDQVQLAGMRVELSEVSNALRSCPGVEDAVAVAPEVDGELRLVAFHTGAPLSAVELTAHLKRLLPRGMLPRRFLHLDQFPLNVNRKVDRRALRQTAAAALTRLAVPGPAVPRPAAAGAAAAGAGAVVADPAVAGPALAGAGERR